MPHRAWKPAVRRRQLVVQRIAAQAVVYDTRTHHAYSLAEAALQVFDLCDGTRTIDDLVGSAATLDPEDVVAIVDELAGFDLFVADPRMLRRQAITVPLATTVFVTSMLVPTAAFASSCVGLLGNCATRSCCPGLSCVLNKLGIPPCS